MHLLERKHNRNQKCFVLGKLGKEYFTHLSIIKETMRNNDQFSQNRKRKVVWFFMGRF